MPLFSDKTGWIGKDISAVMRGGGAKRPRFQRGRQLGREGGSGIYNQAMKTTVGKDLRRTTMVPVTTMEEMPLLSEAESTDMIASLKAAEAEIAAGQFVEHDSSTFVDRMIALREAYGSKRVG
jgi:hypothetical protein